MAIDACASSHIAPATIASIVKAIANVGHIIANAVPDPSHMRFRAMRQDFTGKPAAVVAMASAVGAVAVPHHVTTAVTAIVIAGGHVADIVAETIAYFSRVGIQARPMGI